MRNTSTILKNKTWSYKGLLEQSEALENAQNGFLLGCELARGGIYWISQMKTYAKRPNYLYWHHTTKQIKV
jgi:hypothetical protein